MLTPRLKIKIGYKTPIGILSYPLRKDESFHLNFGN